MSAIPAHVRMFSSVKNRKLAQINGKDFEKKTHFIHVRPADQIDVVIVAIHGDNNDKDVADTAQFVALNPRFAAKLAVMIEDVLVHDLKFDFDKAREETLKQITSNKEVVADSVSM